MVNNIWWNLLPVLSLIIHSSASQTSDKCGAPRSNPNTQLEDKYLQRTDHRHGEKVVFRCSFGYTQNRGSRLVRCEKGQWTPLTLTCIRKSCGSAGEILYGRFKYDGALFGDRAYAICNEGYTLRGEDHRQCLDGTWSGKIPTCEEAREEVPAPITCPNPSVANAVKKSREVSVYRVRDSVTFTCTEGFVLTGSQQITCAPDGQWQPQPPQCRSSQVSKCPAINIMNGKVSTGLRQYGSSVKISCSEGYQLRGANQLSCARNSSWTPEIPKCVAEAREEVPAPITCPNPSVANAVKKSGEVSVYRVRDSVTFTCTEGFVLTGSQQITCAPDGQWQPQPPQCRSSSGKCGAPPHHPNAHPRGEYILQKEFQSGARVLYTCAIGYRRIGGTSIIRCNGGQWARVKLRCERKRCGSAGEIRNGSFMYTGASFGDTATAECNEGFHIVGQNKRHCINKGWDGRIPVCEAVQCPEPPEVTDAEMTGSPNGLYVYRNVVDYRCLRGRLIGESEIFCTLHGTWSAPAPQCKGARG